MNASGQQLKAAIDDCVQLVASGRTERATAELRRVLAAVTGPAEFVERMGVEFQQITALFPLAEVAFERLSELRPGDAMPVARLGACVVVQRDFERGEAILRRAVGLDPAAVWPRTQLAGLLERTNRLDAALHEAQQAVEREPSSSAALLVLGQIERRLGKLDDSRAHLTTALDSKGLGARLEMRLRGQLGFTLDALGEHDDAFNEFERSQALWLTMPAPSRIDPEAYPKRIAAFRELVESADFANWPTARPEGSRPAPVFFVGFPRSGTTLLEQMLGAHGSILGSEEMPFLGQALQQAEQGQIEQGQVDQGGTAIPAGLASMDEGARAEIERAYWAGVEAALGPIGDRVLLDKLPLTIVELAAVYRVFPDAKVIVALRDPRDCVLSAFMQEFGANIGMVHTASLGSTAKLYQGVMGLWLATRDRLPIRWIESKYEDLVAAPERQMRMLIEFLGLDWDAEVLEGGGSKVSRTPSYQAVGGEIHTRATQKWRNYQSKLGAVRGELEPFVDVFGYGPWDGTSD